MAAQATNLSIIILGHFTTQSVDGFRRCSDGFSVEINVISTSSIQNLLTLISEIEILANILQIQGYLRNLK